MNQKKPRGPARSGTAQAMGGRLPRVQTRLEFMDALEEMIVPPKNDEELSSKGRLGELKTYILESNGGFPSRLESGGMQCEVEGTGLDRMKILRVRRGEVATEFFLDMKDERFLRLHTNARAEDTNRIVNALVRDGNHTFDNVWLHSSMLKRLADRPGNSFRGFGISYSGRVFRPGEGEHGNADSLSLSISGSLAKKIQDIVENIQDVRRVAAHSSVRIMRGSGTDPYDFVQDDIHSTGYFAAKRGKSVQDHLRLVDACKDEYSRTIADIESMRIGTSEVGGKMLAGGRPFDFVFPDGVEDLDLFIDGMFNSAMPFNLWGMKSVVRKGYYKILAVDLHTGSPVDFEIARDFMRVYLFKGGCGNTLLRILTNLQLHYDAGITCDQIGDCPSGNAPD